MQFEDKKLNQEAVEGLFQSPIISVEPYVLMLAPVYIFMKLNQKFVSVKAPLDFFTPEELEKLKPYESFYLPKFVKNSVRYQTAARLIQNLLKNPNAKNSDLELAPYEVSNEALKIMAKLWGKEIKIEPFFMATFTHELCETLKPELLVWAREQNVAKHDFGLLLSGVFGFVAVHLGYFDYEQINFWRDEIYKRTAEGETWESPSNEIEAMVSDLCKVMKVKNAFERQDFEYHPAEWAKKLSSRLNRIKKNFSSRAEVSPSIYGDEGFTS